MGPLLAGEVYKVFCVVYKVFCEVYKVCCDVHKVCCEVYKVFCEVYKGHQNSQWVTCWQVRCTKSFVLCTKSFVMCTKVMRIVSGSLVGR